MLGVYLVCLAMLMVVFLVLLVLAFVVTRPDHAYSIPQVGFREYRLESWLRDQVTGNDNLGKIRACLADTQTCSKLANKYFSAADFFAGHLSPVEVLHHHPSYIINRSPSPEASLYPKTKSSFLVRHHSYMLGCS